MPEYAISFSVTQEAWTDLKGEQADDFAAPWYTYAETLGGSVQRFRFTHGPYDGLAIVDLPDSGSLAAFRMLLVVTGTYRTVDIEELISPEDVQAALNKPGVKEIW